MAVVVSPVKLTVTWLEAATVESPVGAAGADTVLTLADAVEAAEAPEPLVAFTV